MNAVSFLRAFALGAALLCVHGIPSAADHRDAPAIFAAPFLDLNDVYMFRNPADSSKLVMIMTTHPLSEPEFALSYPFQANAVYRFQFSNRTDGVPTARIDFEFRSAATGQEFTAVFPGVSDPIAGPVTPATVVRAKPNAPIVTHGPSGSGIRITAGPFDDPFFFDAVGFNRLLALLREQPIDRPNRPFRGNNSFAGFNVNAIVVEFPIALVKGASPRVDSWGVTYTINDTSLTGPARYDDGNLTQVDRNGNPGINTALIGILPSFGGGARKNAFNLGLPENDARDFGDEIVATLRDFYGTPLDNILVLGAVGLPDTLKLDTSKPDGFPNGRRLEDDVIDVELSLITNGAIPTDGANKNDTNRGRFLSHFPYLTAAQQPPQKHQGEGHDD
jgi:hypothetical protein